MPNNLILLHTDQQRRDSLGCYGNAAARTPNLDRLAGQGARFDHHYASNPVCMPSRASLLTGRHLPAHGVIDNGIPLDTREATLAAILGHAGYDTFAAGKLHLTPYQSPDMRHGESFRAWESGALDGWDGPYYGFRRVRLVLDHGEGPVNPRFGHYGQWLAREHAEVFGLVGAEHAPEPKFPGVYRSRVPPELHHSNYIADQVIEYLEAADGNTPFFVFAGFPDPHAPFVPPEAYAERFDGVEFPDPAQRAGEHDSRPSFYRRLLMEDLFAQDGNARRAPEGEHFRHIVQNTYAMVSLIDDAVGRILDAVERRGLADKTIVCFTSDHGDLLGDHGLLYKAQLPFASLMRVPFILRAPGILRNVVQAPMGNADVAPTLLDLAGVPVPASVQGLSYVPVLAGLQPRVREAVLSCGWSKTSPDFRHMSLHGDAWRLTWWPGLEQGELYDLRADPHELDNVYNADPYYAEREWLMEELLKAYAKAGPLEPHVLCDW
ncbi:MAG TPA: sulfatase-like hydrolase/transferase [Candidatus Hydrogenedentes bacterium]|nr:sulfatase-like hydrolase/transferase [Candidatus Hydrogenedentota bacterium]HPG66738.1 sulfatase-like hydrolase/transferase [Candidatus Hydrogenedentota bacterium]